MRPRRTPDRTFTKEQVQDLLNATIGKTLEQIDKFGQFELHKGQTKVTGIAGDIIELSVLGCKRDAKQEADIEVDGVDVEIKTTGLVKLKKKTLENPNYNDFVCKEPVSITAVSISTIVHEEFESSKFWHKLANVLWVYYWYKSPVTVKLDGYKNFPVLGYHFYVFSNEDKLRLKHDWLIVRDFLILINKEYKTTKERNTQYPRLSHELRSQLLLIDTAPKFPNSPRFRLKRSFATTIAQEYFSNKGLEKLHAPITKYSDIDNKCEQLTKLYAGKSFEEIAKKLGVNITRRNNIDGNSVSIKNFAELVVLKMFGTNATKLNDIDDFAKIGLIAKSLPLNKNGKPKESMKMFKPNFNELIYESSFEESFIRSYFAEHQFLLIVYQYTSDKDNKEPKHITFVGFKRVYFTDDFIYTEAQRFWEDVRSLIKDKKLRIVKEFNKEGTPKINQKTGTQKEAPNFPKEKDYKVFMRGSAPNTKESSKTLLINGLKMLPQEIWLSKDVTFELFKNQKL